MEKVLVAMSGGVDSSVAAALLLEQGYDVTGAYMVNYDENSPLEGGRGVLACWRDDYRDAMRVAAKLGIQLLKLDFRKEYKEKVLDYMFAEYQKGRTPNPDVLCNKYIKFGVWLDKARELGFTKLATGHYARVDTPPAPPLIKGGKDESAPFLSKKWGKESATSLTKEEKKESVLPPLYKGGIKGGLFHLLQAKDKNKDQTYFLHQLNQAQLQHVLFPLGEYTKAEVRELAKKYALPTAEKEESMGICFVGEVAMKEFLQNKIKQNKGDIILSPSALPVPTLCREEGVGGEGVIGKHEGLAFYTLGQRHGFAQAGGGQPLFVIKKDFTKNQLIVGYEDDLLLYKKETEIEAVHWIGFSQRSPQSKVGQKPEFPLKCKVRLRHRQELQDGVVVGNKIVFNKAQRAVTPGQFAVFYKDSECLGGGVIK